MENRKELMPIITQAIKIDVKPLSVNSCWQGKRFKTDAYKAYEKEMLLKLPKIKVPDGKLTLNLEFGVSNVCQDIDNGAKPFIDILQKKYWFNDRDIWQLNITKTKVAKGQEFVKFSFIAIEV